jgi:hypothetical protein
MSYNIAMANNPAQSEDRRLIQGQVFTIMLLLAFTIVISWRLIGGSVAPTQGFMWMGFCCIAPIVWYIFGYLKAKDNMESNALIASSIGWVFVALGFLVHYNKLMDTAETTPAGAVSDPLTPILLLLGLLILVVGGMFSWQAATKSELLD